VRIVVNRLSTLGKKTGIGHYTVELLRCLRQQAGDQIACFPSGWLWHVRQWWSRYGPLPSFGADGPEAGQGREKKTLRRWALAPFAALKWAALNSLRYTGRACMAAHLHRVFKASFDLYHEPNLIPLPCDRPTLATLHDLSVLLHPEWHPTKRVKFFERHFQRGVSQCIHFLAISEFGRQEAIRILNLAPQRVTRTYMGIRSDLRPLSAGEVAPVLQRLGLPPRYLLYLGTLEPRKNLEVLLRAYCGLPEALRSRWPLLLVGTWGWNTQRLADLLHTEARHRGVVHLGYVADEHLAAIYNGARALVYPSLYEGFGLPPVEMMACGGAVLASTAGALVETVGARACLLEPQDEAGWRDAMRRVLLEDDWWQSLRQGAVELARPFTWERCAHDTLRVYRSLTAPPKAKEPDLRKRAA
jgi:alpha-1,3-rhamnosyl/mannosyltransferase